jgi:OOP family OmpA-OmpF porin
MKKQTGISLIFFMVLFVSANGQNLVPNYSFENIIQCTQHCNEFNGYVADWTGQDDGSGLFYFTAQCPNDTTWPSGSVPYNYYYGFQYAHTGVSYAGILTFVNGGNDTSFPYTGNTYSEARNYIQAKLSDSLKAGKTYYVTFYTNLQNASNYACSSLGAYLSDSALVFNNGPNLGPIKSYLTPQVSNDPKKQELTDTLNWMKISGAFIAKGGEKYIIIGNFKNDSLSYVHYLGKIYSENLQAYYYIDDVIVSPDSNYADSLATVSVQSISKPKEMTEVFPNPSTGIFTFNFSDNTEKNTLTIYNMFGENIYNTQFNTTTTQIDLSGRPDGVYLYRVVNENGEAVASGKLVIQ